MGSSEISLGRVIASDAIALLALLFGLAPAAAVVFAFCVFVVSGSFPVTVSQHGPPWYVGLLAGAAVGIPLVAASLWWASVTCRALREGKIVPGRVEAKTRSRYGIVLRYTFEESGNIVRRSAFCTDNRRVRRLNRGRSVLVSLDPNGVKRGFVRDVYLDNAA